MDDIDKTMPGHREFDGEDVSMGTEKGARDRILNGRFRTGDLIMGRYKVLAELGQGGMGVVYKCFDETAGIEIALKALPPELSHNTLEMEDIKDNFQLVHNLHHPNIASYNTLEKDPANGNYYLIMECVNGEDLRRWIKRKRKHKWGSISPETVLPVIRQVAEALDYAHGQRVIHRDIKPGNIMIDLEGNIKVLDFGLAAQIHTSMTRVSMVDHGTSGTGPYMSPEQWKGGHNQGAASDQYALAVMTYEMLAGYLPFENPDVAILRESVLKDAPDPIEKLSDRINDVLRKALEKNQRDRYPSCADFVSALAGETSAPGVPPDEEEKHEEHNTTTDEAKGQDVPVNEGKALFNGTVTLPGNVQLEMVKVESGTFTMSKWDGENYSSEKEHTATLTKDFYIGKYEVTQAQWQAVMGNNPSYFKGDNLPVENVSWHEAIEFCEKLNECGLAPAGWHFTLPTETQWEYAAVGGKKSHGYKYSGSNTIDGVGWYSSNSGGKTHPVGTKVANELGLYDMTGNVNEWCLDDWNGDSSKSVPEFRRSHDSSDADRVSRGGNWFFISRVCRSAYRLRREPGDRSDDLGFRLALVPK